MIENKSFCAAFRSELICGKYEPLTGNEEMSLWSNIVGGFLLKYFNASPR